MSFSNANLPPGTWEGDPMSPWNRPEPHEGATCGECAHCRDFRRLDGSESSVCVIAGYEAEEVDPSRPAWECFEGAA